MKALSNVYGKIKRLLLVVPMRNVDSIFDESKILERYQRLFDALADRVSFIVIGNFQFGEDIVNGMMVKGLLMDKVSIGTPPYKINLIDLSLLPEVKEGRGDNFPSIWAQDPFCVLSKPNRTSVLLEPFEFAHRGNQVIAEHLSSALDYNLRSTRFYIEGGNILVGDDYMFIGKNLLKKNQEAFCPNESLESAAVILAEEFRKRFGVDHVFWVGLDETVEYRSGLNAGSEKLQPLFHLDLFVTLGGLSSNGQGKEIVFVAEVREEDINSISNSSNKDDLIQLQKALSNVSETISAFSDQLHGPEFDVVLIPLKVSESKKGLEIFSFNNCLVEIYGNVRKVYLPEYGDVIGHKPNLDDCSCARCHSESFFRAMGFRVIYVDGSFQSYSQGEGSLHCMVKVLQRDIKNY